MNQKPRAGASLVGSEVGAERGQARLRGRQLGAHGRAVRLLRCGVCGARMHAQTVKRGQRYAYDFYVCGFAKDKEPTVYRTWYRRDRLEGSLLARFRKAMTPGGIAEGALWTWRIQALGVGDRVQFPL